MQITNEKMWSSLCVFTLLCALTLTKCSKTAMELIIAANKPLANKSNVDEFDMYRPQFTSSAGSGYEHAAARATKRLWPGGIIPYAIDVTILDGNGKNRWKEERPRFEENLKKAIKEWETYTCLDFRDRKKSDRDYVFFTYGNGCNAHVGKRSGRQKVTLGRGCSDPSVIMHEIGHVIGFWHEQNRPDRDKYVEIIWDNISNEFKFAFDKYSERRINSLDIPYDYQSIMHYDKNAFSKNGSATIKAKLDNVTQFGNDRLSPLDIKQANLLYNCPAAEDVYPKFPEDFVVTQNGSIPSQLCTEIYEPRKKKRKTVWLCHKQKQKAANIVWSPNGKVPYMTCTHISSPFGADRHGWWKNNYLCVANDSVYEFHWSKYKPISNMTCLKWANYNAYLCGKTDLKQIDGGWTEWSSWSKCTQECSMGFQERQRYCTNPVPKNYGKHCYGEDYQKQFCNLQECAEYPIWPDDFSFGYFKYTPRDKKCIRVYERDGSLLWNNYYFCSHGNKRDIHMRWSDNGPEPGMICINIKEPLDNRGWHDNYLCVPHHSKYRFEWSYSGPIHGLKCVHWQAKNGSDGWNNNYLCGKPVHIVKKPGSADSSSVAAAAGFVGPIDGGWSKWSAWTSCSKSCDGGIQRRRRTCTEPTPSVNGRYCMGRSLHHVRCFITDCPKPCQGSYSGDKGRLTSPKYPNYPQNSNCFWKIAVTQGKQVEIKFPVMKLKGATSTCSSDKLTVRDGGNSRSTILKTYCSNPSSVQTLQSTSNEIFLELKTSDRLVHGGFKAEWVARLPAPEKAKCNRKYTRNRGRFASPQYPRNYPPNTKCTWHITAPLNIMTEVLEVRFDYFKLEQPVNNVCYDKLVIYDGMTERSPKHTFCGSTKPGVFTAFTNSLLIKFESDGNKSFKGFIISWYTRKR